MLSKQPSRRLPLLLLSKWRSFTQQCNVVANDASRQLYRRLFNNVVANGGCLLNNVLAKHCPLLNNVVHIGDIRSSRWAPEEQHILLGAALLAYSASRETVTTLVRVTTRSSDWGKAPLFATTLLSKLPSRVVYSGLRLCCLWVSPSDFPYPNWIIRVIMPDNW